MSLRTSFLALLCAISASLSAQDIVGGVDFTTFFDNREFSPCREQTSLTQFSARLTPWVGVQWNKSNRLVAGVRLRRDFGRDDDFLTSTDMMFYYRFTSKHWRAHMGIFDRGVMLGKMNDIIYDPLNAYQDDRIMGAHFAWRGKHSHVEAAIDWEGQPTEKTREKFRILSTAQRAWKHAYIGYDMSMLHLANDAQPDEVNPTGVVDHIQMLPYAGATFDAFFHFDARATLVASVQRDRRAKESHTPLGGMFSLAMSRWDVTVQHQFYTGKGQQPFAARYGELLYSGSPLYSARHYNKTTLSYAHSFFKRTLNLDVRFIFHHDGYGMGTEQLLTLGVNLEKAWSLKGKTKH